MSGTDLKVRLNQMILPDDFDAAELDGIAQRVGGSDIRVEADVTPGSEPRDIDITQSLFVLQFFTQHATDLALGVASGAFWDAIKYVANRLRLTGDRPGAVTIGMQYADGDILTVNLNDSKQVRQVLRELRGTASSRKK
jgi:hypothetical protein